LLGFLLWAFRRKEEAALFAGRPMRRLATKPFQDHFAGGPRRTRIIAIFGRRESVDVFLSGGHEFSLKAAGWRSPGGASVSGEL